MRKLVSILLTLAVAVSLLVVPAVVSANPGGVELTSEGNGTAEWTTDQAHSGSYSVKFTLPDPTVDGVDGASVKIPLSGLTFSEITPISYWYYVDESTGIKSGCLDKYVKGIGGPGYPPAEGPAVYYDVPPGVCLNIGLDANLDGVVDTWIIQWEMASEIVNTWREDDIGENEIFFIYPDVEGWEPIPVPWPPYGPDWPDPLTYKAYRDGYPLDFMGIVGPDGVTTLGDLPVLEVSLGSGWKPGPALVYVDDITINGTTYDLEPNTTVGLTADVEDIVAINVDPTSIDFGTLKPGQTSSVERIDVENIGTHTVNVDVWLTPQSASLFKNNLEMRFDATGSFAKGAGAPRTWSDIITNLVMNDSKYVQTRLPVPLDYTPKGSEEATLIFEATGV